MEHHEVIGTVIGPAYATIVPGNAKGRLEVRRVARVREDSRAMMEE
jgi:hypothetical protein